MRIQLRPDVTTEPELTAKQKGPSFPAASAEDLEWAAGVKPTKGSTSGKEEMSSIVPCDQQQGRGNPLAQAWHQNYGTKSQPTSKV